jgi:hypothetical protein
MVAAAVLLSELSGVWQSAFVKFIDEYLFESRMYCPGKQKYLLFAPVERAGDEML